MNRTAHLKASMLKIRHMLHSIPELGFSEVKTSEFVIKQLQSYGITETLSLGKTGVVGILKKGTSQNSIALRAELDALAIFEQNNFAYRSKHEGKMHACGHDGHSSMLLGAAAYLAKESQFDGTVYFIFQPDEEHGKGALAMIEDDLFNKCHIDEIYSMHNMPSFNHGTMAIRPGVVMASEDDFEIKIKGKGGHSALAHNCIDPIVIGSHLIVSLQTIISRCLDPNLNAVVSVTEFLSDGGINIIPENVILRGDVRSLSVDAQELIEKKIFEISEGLIQSYGATCSIKYEKNFIPTINTPLQSAKAKEAALMTNGIYQIEEDFPPFMTSEDFGYMINKKPGCYILIGNGNKDSKYNFGLHHPKYDFNDNNLCIGADFWVNLVEMALKK